jgi:hypothetical protein
MTFSDAAWAIFGRQRKTAPQNRRRPDIFFIMQLFALQLAGLKRPAG